MPKGSCVLDSIRKLGWSSMPNIRSWLITIQSYFDDIPIKPLYTRTRYYLFGVWIGQRFLERMKFFPRAKDLNCERSPRTNVSITEVYYLVMYIISQVRVRRTSPVRNYLRLHGAYVINMISSVLIRSWTRINCCTCPVPATWSAATYCLISERDSRLFSSFFRYAIDLLAFPNLDDT